MTEPSETTQQSEMARQAKTLHRPTHSWLIPSRLVGASIFAAVAQIVATVVSLIAERRLPSDPVLAEASSLNVILSVTSVVHMVLFFAGAVGLFAGFMKGLGRSRHEELSVGGLFFLSGQTAVEGHQRIMLGALAAQVFTGFAGAGLAPLTPVAFTSLAPAAGFGCLAMYGAFLGAFAELDIDSRV